MSLIINKKEFIFIKLFVIISVIFFHNYAKSTSVTFIVPGKSDEDFWVTSAEFTKAAAHELGFEIEILYAERDRFYMVDLARDVSKREKKPDFVFIVNEKQSAPQMLLTLNENKVKTILIHIDLTNDQKQKIQHPREKLNYWLASIFPDNVQAGYQIANEIYKSAQKKLVNKKNFTMIAINGDKATKTSLERESGLSIFLKEHKNVNLLQSLSAEWSREIAYEKMNILQKRYKSIDLVWAANDPIALGSLKSLEESGKKPGKNVFIGGLNWQQEAISEIKKGNLVTSLGGHFMNGACALIILYDYLHGIDIQEKIMK